MLPLKASRPVGTICAACVRRVSATRPYSTTLSLQYAESTHLPRVASTSLWSYIIPKPIRQYFDPEERARLKAQRKKEWNPATIFILLGILVGSNAIQLIALRNDTLSFSRKTEAKLSRLREVVQRVKDGEDIDVKKELGTGDAEQEAEWEEVVKELERTDMLEEGRKKREAKRAETAKKAELANETAAQRMAREGASSGEENDGPEKPSERRPKFLM